MSRSSKGFMARTRSFCVRREDRTKHFFLRGEAATAERRRVRVSLGFGQCVSQKKCDLPRNVDRRSSSGVDCALKQREQVAVKPILCSVNGSSFHSAEGRRGQLVTVSLHLG